jgi:phosphate transport system permease protein
MKKNISENSRRNDKIAALLIRVGGMLVILSVIWILVMISKVSLPLFFPPKAKISASFSLPESVKTGTVLAGGVDDSGSKSFVLDLNGAFHFFDATNGQLLETIEAPSKPSGAVKLASAEMIGKYVYTLIWDNNSATSVSVGFSSASEKSKASDISYSVTANENLSFPGAGKSLQSFIRRVEDKGSIRVDRLEGDRFRVSHRIVEKDLMDNESVKNTTAEIAEPLPAPVTACILDYKGRYLYAGTSNGQLLRWDVSEPGNPRLVESTSVTKGAAVTALNLVLGDFSLAIGDATGKYTTWFPVSTPGSGEDKRLTLIHKLPDHAGKVSAIVPSLRDKSLISFSENGELRIDHTTSERTLVSLGKSSNNLVQASYSPRCTALTTLDSSGKVAIWNLDIPHPEVSLGTLFGKVWYEGYDKPEYVWQSSSASDSFEPKMSLVPLIFGTLKATVFAMILAVPLALLGALYTSQFMTPEVKSKIKPTVEIMAAIPSVVIGFLAGLWLAPMIDKAVLTLFIALFFVPLMIVVSTVFWRLIKPYSRLGALLRGNEFILFIPLVLLGVYLSWLLGGWIELTVFAGDFKQWMYSSVGIGYDQRNCIIIAVALGFAVIPIIFTIAEDALSNVPRNLSAASMALGASRWQTAWRVVLPSALPGVFSAIMIGFGRAIGETMIVLMATGNTPIMSWSPFNGLRSLSANIAVEIPEAPLDGSLYRVLFLSAVLLFLFTFIINTAAEALRQKFRKKYGRY